MQGVTAGQFTQGVGQKFGGAATPAQYQPPAQAPRTFADVVQSMPPAVRQMVGVMGPEKGLPLLMKYADPETVPAFDPRSGQMVFVPKTALRSGQYQPVDAATLGLSRQRFDFDREKFDFEKKKFSTEQGQKGQFVRGVDGLQRWVPANEYAEGMPNYDKPPTEIERGNYELAKRRAAGEEANRDILPGGQPNQPLLDFKKGVSAAQGTDPQGKMLVGDYDDARKANTELQSGALVARTGMAQTNRLGQLLDQVNTGRFTSTTQDIKQMAKGIGINLEALGVRDDTAPAQAAQALTGQLALALRNPSGGAGMPGALSDADRQFLVRMVPSLETTSEGRKLMIGYAQKMYQRQVDLAKVANDFMRSAEAKKDPSALYQKLQEYADANPLFSEKDAPQQTKAGSLPMPGKVRRYNPATGALE
jgi:hypothetical protein